VKISILTLFPKMIDGFINESIVKRAQEKKLVEIEIVNIRDFTDDAYGTVDGKPYGGGVGMVMRVDILYKALISVIPNSFRDLNKKILNPLQGKQVQYDTKKTQIILTSAKGKTYDQSIARQYSTFDHLIVIAGHYEGVDERILDYVDEEISVGDYVLTGGELPACIIADSVTRLLPGVLKHKEATENESFSQALCELTTNDTSTSLSVNQRLTTMLEYPQYTRPEEFMGKKVPEVLLSGDHKRIEEWRLNQALKETKKKRPDMLK